MTHTPALTVMVTFGTVVFPVFDGPLVDWFAGKQDVGGHEERGYL